MTGIPRPRMTSSQSPIAGMRTQRWPISVSAYRVRGDERQSPNMFNDDDFEILYPGVYTDREGPRVEKYLADNAALAARGAIDVSALVAGTLSADTPGVGPVLPVTREMVDYDNAKYEPESALLRDPEVARAFGYADTPAYETFGAHDDTFAVPFPPAARDTISVSQLNHEVQIHAPIYPGDTLYLVTDARTLTDRTPTEGSTYRTITLASNGSVYNQRGEKVNTVLFRITESLRQFRPGRAPAEITFADSWDAPDWMARPAHVYTDADWDLIREIWRNERHQAAAPLYWENVAVGDRPRATLDGPIDVTVMPTAPYGLGTGGSRTLKREILDDETFSGMTRSDDGIYRLADARAHVPAVPDGAISPVAGMFDPGSIDTRDIHKEGEERSVVVNFFTREVALRHIHSWIGYHGRLAAIKWQIMEAATNASFGKPVPVEVGNPRYLDLVPELADRSIGHHGLTKDVAHVRSYVFDKRVVDGEFLADLAWWIEDIEGEIWAAGAATVALPSSRRA